MAIKQNANELVCCLECEWATYMQWFDNPIVAQCEAHDEKEVAATRRDCKDYKKRTKPMDIQHFDSYDRR